MKKHFAASAIQSWILLGLFWLVAWVPGRAQAVVFYESSKENPQRYPSIEYLTHVTKGLQQPALRDMPERPKYLSFALLTNADGTIRDVVLNNPVPEPHATALKAMLRQGPAAVPYIFRGQPVATVIPVGVNWEQALTAEASSAEQVAAVRMTSVIQVPDYSAAGSQLVVELALKSLRGRLRKDLAGQPLRVEVGVSAQGRVERWQPLNLQDPALATEAERRVLETARRLGRGTPLKFGGTAYASRQVHEPSLNFK
ncbi:hypothetical protein [Hymenobacter sp. B81]|uniref:hypothetical protein n=1 Tax=Hymenobacter sp. B81 TaxID=3344878 RepID=UPI0037DC6984